MATAKRSKTGLRQLAEPFVVAPSSGARIRTRLHPTPGEAAALTAVGEHLGRLYRSDLAARVSMGRVPAKARGRTERKRALTALSSSRWAGAITRAVEDQYQLGMRALAAEIGSLRSAVEALEKRTNVLVGTRVDRVRGYRTEGERFQKTRRLGQLRDRLSAAEEDLKAGRPTVVVGGGRLWGARENLDKAGLTEAEWRQRWDAARLFLTADGETGKRWGNETVRVDGEGALSLKVPAPLVAEFGDRVRLTAPVSFAHRGEEWAERIAHDQCVRYDVSFDVESGRWYLDASWGLGEVPVPPVESLQQGRVLGVDLNADHLAACVLDPHGNPVGEPVTVPLDLDGVRGSTRDARLRAAVTALLDLARDNGCAAVAIEDLNFADARTTGRETMGRGKRGKKFRRTVAGLPTAKFRDRLTSMAANRGLWVLAVDPAYTSKWGDEHWRRPLQSQTFEREVTRHHAASVAIGRRALGRPIRRREDGPRTRQRTSAGQPTPRPARAPRAAAARQGPVRTAVRNRPRPPGTLGLPAPKTVRGARTRPIRTS